MAGRTSDSATQLATLIELWLGTYGSANTRSAYGGDVWAFSQWCHDRGRLTLRASTADIAGYLTSSEGSGVSDATVARRRSALGSFFDFAWQNDAVVENPMPTQALAGPRSPSSTAVLADQDAQALLRASDRVGAKTAALVRLLMLDGLRLHEVLAADASDFEGATARPALIVRRGDRSRSVPLTAPTARRLREYVGRRRRGPLLLSDSPGRDGERLSRFGADYLLKEVARQAHVDAKVSANSLRRRYVAAEVNAGTHLDDIRDHVGHRDVRTTRRYLNPDANPKAPSPSARPERR